MSTFSGKIQEILQISVDRFDGENMESEAYFLSHCHSDHMVGLGPYFFQVHLVKTCKILYASQISCVILKKMFRVNACNLRELHLYSPTTIHLKNSTFSVTPIPAGHCPGSVMFLFEGEKRILYTGDYRINKHDVAKFKSFYNSANEIKLIDKIYLDTTFFLKTYPNFPKREESLQELCEIVEEWIQRGKRFLVKLKTSAKYGYEYIFSEIFKKFNMPVHVNEDMYAFYSLIPEMDNSVTMDGSTTQIHCNCGASYQQVCDFRLDSFLKTIKVSAWRHKQNDLGEGPSNFDDSGMQYVCYSTHASYEEGVELIRLLKPKDIEICVKHDDPYANKEMRILIQEHLAEFKPKEEIKEIQLFPVGNTTNTKSTSFKQSFDDLGVLNSPPRDTILLDSIVIDSKEGMLHCRGDSSGIIDAIVSPIRRVKLLVEPAVLVGTSKNINKEGTDWKSELREIEDSPRQREIFQVKSTLPTFINGEIEQNKEEQDTENCILLNILDLQSGAKHSQSKRGFGESIQGSLESTEYKNGDTQSQNLGGFDDKEEKCDLIDKSEEYKIGEEWEDSILMSIIDTPKFEGSEEDNIILNIIDSPPNKRKK